MIYMVLYYIYYVKLYISKVKVSPLQAMKTHGDVDSRVHIFPATALGRERVAKPTLDRLYPWKASVLILQEA